VSDVRYRFIASGQSDVVGAFRSVTSAAKESAASAMRSGKAGADGARAATRELAQEAAIAKKLTSIRQAEANATLKSSRDAGKAFDAKLKAQQKATADYEKNLRKEVSVFEREEKRKQDILERQTKQRQKLESRANAQIVNDRIATMGRIADRVVGGAVSAVGSRITDMIGTSLTGSLQLSAIANRVSINARGAGKEGASPQQLQREFENVALSTPGIKATDIAEAAQAYVDLTGDLDTARANMQSFATVASATGAEVKDVATAAASLGAKFNVKSVKDMQLVMAAITFQGKGGAMTMKDVAAQFQKLAASAAAFNIGKGPEAVGVLGGLTQIARTASKSPQQAGTAVENVFRQLTAKSSLLRKSGVHVYDKQGHSRDIRDILTEIISQVGGADLEKKKAGLVDIFGAQGYRAISPLISAYEAAASGKTGKSAQDAGAAGVRATLDKFISTASSWSELQKDAAQAQNTTSARVTAAMEQLQQVVGEKVVPALLPLIDKFPELVDALEPVIDLLKDFAEGITSALDNLPGGEERAAKRNARKAQRDLDRLNSDIGIGAPTAKQAVKKSILEARVGAGTGVETIAPGTGKLAIAAGGAANLLGGPAAAALAAGVVGGSGLAAEEQARQTMALRSSGVMETQSGAILSAGGHMQAQKGVSKAAGGALADLDGAAGKTARALEGVAAAAVKAIQEFNSVSRPTLGAI
jgi:hypothetical protein